MNAKETLKKIAEALNIVGGEETIANVVEKTEEVKPQEVAEAVETEVEATPEVVTEVTEEVVEAVVEKTEEVKEDPKASRVEELEGQLNDLKKLLKDAMNQPEPVEVPEIKQEAPKGLTHSPEKEVKKKMDGIGQKGDSIQSRVYKYINNN